MYLILLSNQQTLITRILANGATDSSYGNNGYSQSVEFTAVGGAAQNDGKIIVAGTTQSDRSSFALARYHTDGILDTTFSQDGKQTSNFGFDGDRANAIALQSDGKIIVAGYSQTTLTDSSNGTIRFALARFKTDGAPDSTFSND